MNRLRLLAVLLVAASVGPLAQGGPGISRTAAVLDNPVVGVNRFRFAPGATEQPHTHPFTVIMVQLTRGQVEVLQGDARRTQIADPGHVEIVGRGVTHLAGNPSQAEWDVLVIAAKDKGPEGIISTVSTYVPAAGVAPSVETVNRVIALITPGRLEVTLGEARTTEQYEAGQAIFVPKGTRYSLRNAGTVPFTAVSIGVP